MGRHGASSIQLIRQSWWQATKSRGLSQVLRRKFNALRAETLQWMKEEVMKQMRVAHQIAHLLGETTADSKMTVSHLTKLLEEEWSRHGTIRCRGEPYKRKGVMPPVP